MLDKYLHLQYYDTCSKWQDLADDPDTYSEQALFEEGPEVEAAVQRVNRRLGFDGEEVEKLELEVRDSNFKTSVGKCLCFNWINYFDRM